MERIMIILGLVLFSPAILAGVVLAMVAVSAIIAFSYIVSLFDLFDL